MVEKRNRLSLDSRDTVKSTPKLKGLPLSLDSREGSMRVSFDSKTHHPSKGLQHVASQMTETLIYLILRNF
ncbi:unnamed protein product [Prunus armeniaca]|uniref:Uncharacterized protein n=1 Tax=Prunus armeniaca TaxID=36596 RepID=A0A6J5V0C5_PRUAR|nr:unnamed protein product [Prunus armeniaca]